MIIIIIGGLMAQFELAIAVITACLEEGVRDWNFWLGWN